MNNSENKISFQPTFVILSSLIIFTLFWYFGRIPFFNRNLTGIFPETSFTPLYPFFYFCVCSVLFRMVLPIVLVKVALRGRLKDFGYGLPKAFKSSWGYLFLFLLVLPFVYMASLQDSFINYYPRFKGVIFNQQVTLQHLILFELFYGLLFLSGESFWRGYMIFGLRKHFGYYSLFIMVIPYVMSHYPKPFLEAMGAIAAGLILGYLALRHNHFWFGFLVHWGVAIVMDLLALYQLGVAII